MSEELKANVLIVDDEQQFLDVLSQRLKTRGLTIDAVSSGEEAIKHAKGKNFDAIVLDLVMPGLTGLETLKKLRADNPDLQIIILTGHATVEKGVEAIKEGAVEFLEKPVDINKLLAKIGESHDRKILLFSKKAEEHVKELLERKGW